jgi:hypothetical protein
MISGIAQGLLNVMPMFGGDQPGDARRAASAAGATYATTAAQRREHLMALFEAKGCRVSELRK